MNGLDIQQIYNYFTDSQPPVLETMKIGGGIYLAKGEWGANVGFFVGNEGVFMIDSKATYSATKKIIREINKVTPKPISKVAFTHSDSDCFNGYEAYPDSADIICSEKSRRELAMGMWTLLEMNVPSSIYPSEATSRALPGFHPAIAFDGRIMLQFGSETIELISCGPAHTSGDIAVYFPARGVAFIGDLAFVHNEPLVQSYKGGYSFGLVTALSMLIGIKPEIKTFIPAHEDPIGREKLIEILRSIEDLQAKVLVMFNEGKSAEEVKLAFHVPTPPTGAGEWIWPSLAMTTFRELSERRVENSMPEIKGKAR